MFDKNARCILHIFASSHTQSIASLAHMHNLLIDKYGFLQKVVKIDPEKENADTVAQTNLAEYGKLKESFSFEIVEKYDSYTRAGEVIDLDGVRYVIESTAHSLVDGWHYDKLGLRKIA